MRRAIVVLNPSSPSRPLSPLSHLSHTENVAAKLQAKHSCSPRRSTRSPDNKPSSQHISQDQTSKHDGHHADASPILSNSAQRLVQRRRPQQSTQGIRNQASQRALATETYQGRDRSSTTVSTRVKTIICLWHAEMNVTFELALNSLFILKRTTSTENHDINTSTLSIF